MKRIVILTLFVAAIASAQPIQQQPQQPPTQPANCSAATLKGDYIWAQDGSANGGKTLIAAAGHDTFDGAGKFRGAFTASENGAVHRRTYNGTYTIKSDCSGTLTMTDNAKKTMHYDFFTFPGGEEIVWVQTDPGTVSSGWERRRMGPPPRPREPRE